MNDEHCVCGHSKEQHDIEEDEFDGDTLRQVGSECILGCNCRYYDECECIKCNGV